MELTSTVSESKMITDLNTDCMEYIFNYLELKDLLSLADSSKGFYTSLCSVFKKKYCKLTLKMGDVQYVL